VRTEPLPHAQGDLPVTALRPLRAPRQDGAVLAEPSLAEVTGLLATNEQPRRCASLDLLGRSWVDLSRQARQSLLAEARAYLTAAGEPLPTVTGTHILMAGHQPELFHPGVWLKNFALHGLARQHGGTAVNLLVDNDTVKTTAVRVPRLPEPPEKQPQLVTVPFDHWPGEVPYEEAAVHDEAQFASFRERVLEEMKGAGFEPLLASYWPEVLRHANRTNLLGERFAAARRSLERRWGCHNLEVPISRVCATEPFAWFAAHLLVHLPRFHRVYNESVREYRRAHGIRSRNHPVPELTSEDGWLEVPLWGWRAGQTQRRRLLVRLAGDAVELRAGAERWPALPRGSATDRRPLVAAWQDLERHGFKARSRALTNTLYARLFLCDLFIHGIGGGKYDALTDTLLQRFYGVEPPRFLVLTGTHLLPLRTRPAKPDDCRRLARLLRDLEWNPQRHLDATALADPQVKELTERKRALLADEPTSSRRRREWFERLRDVTERLRLAVLGQRQRVQQELASCEQELAANAILQRRDYAFCLYPEATVRPFCTQFL
jgi:hypothetical protein